MPLALVSLRAEGRDPDKDDLIESVARVDPREAHAAHVYTARIRSLHGGRRHHDDGAVWLVDAMDELRTLTHGCVLAAWDASPRGTSSMPPATTGSSPARPCPEEHRPAVAGMADRRGRGRRLRHARGRLRVAAHRLPPSTCALEDVRALAEVYRRVVKHPRPRRLQRRRAFDHRHDHRPHRRRSPHVRSVARGRGRDNPREALAEVMDALNYCAAELVRLSKGSAA